MKNLPLSLLVVLTLATAVPAFADEIGPGYCDIPELCTSASSTGEPVTVAEPEDETAGNDDEVSFAEYLGQIFTP